MVKAKETFKKKLMKYLWRIQQSQMVISMVFWSLTLTGIFYDKVREWSGNFWVLPEDAVFLGMMVMFTIVVMAIIVFGIIYDKLKFWKEQQLVIVERNPYTSWKLNPVHTMWADLWLEIAKNMEKRSPALEAKIEFFEKWVERCEEVDPWTKEMRTLTRKFALEGDDSVMRVFARNETD